MPRIHHRIAGALVPSDRWGPVFDPAEGREVSTVALASTAQVDEAVSVAATAQADWAESSVSHRQHVMFAYRGLLEEHRRELATIVSREHGKTIDDAEGEVQRGIEVVDFACNIAHHLKGEFSEQVSSGVDTYTIRQPLGVVAGITPFNFPAMVPMWMYPIAIACGNAFVLKPSEKDPSASMMLAELFERAGLPAGVLNVVHGDRVAVDAILAHPDVAAVSFVGSTPIARHVYATGAAAGKRVQALGGAKNHMVVLPDADIELAADAAVSAAYGSAGERCMAISAIVAVGDAGDRLVPAIEERLKGLRVGAGDDPEVHMGPLVTREHLARVTSYVHAGVSEGAQLVADGRDVEVTGHPDGYFLGPTLFDHVTTDMTVYSDEIFGPVLSVLRVEDHEAAIALVNDSPYGNGTAVFTRSGGAARQYQHEIQVGMVGINLPIPVPLSFYSFGGWKSSIFGSSPIYGPHGVDFYTRQKVVISRWPAEPRGLELDFPTHG